MRARASAHRIRARDGSGDRRRVGVVDSLEDFIGLEGAWNALALPARSPFLTHEWLRSWWSAYPDPAPMALTLRGAGGSLQAAACLKRTPGREVRAAANVYSEHWDVVATDEGAREALWREIAALGTARITLSGVPATSPSVAIAAEALRSARYKVAVVREQLSPYLALPDTSDELLASVSRNLRSQVRRYRKRLERGGRVVFRTAMQDSMERDLDRFFALEASGWKGAAGTAIRNDPRALMLYTEFARSCARRGWLRVYVLELDGVPIAADFTCVLGDCAFLLKTSFDETYAALSPGVVLRAEALRAAIEEGLRFYDFLGGPDRYKLQWTPELRERVVIRAYGGVGGVPPYLYRHKIRPAGGVLVRLGRERFARRALSSSHPGQA